MANFIFGFPPRSHHGASHFSPSETIQDDALTLREILTRYGNGQPLPSVIKEPFYDENASLEDTPLDLSGLDMAEIDLLKGSLQNRISELETSLNELSKQEEPINQPIKLTANEKEKPLEEHS